MLTSQGILRNHYSLVFPAQLISDITKYKRKPSGKFKEKKRKRSYDSQSVPKTKKRKRQREDSNELPDSSSSERSVCETGHKTTEKRTPVAQARVISKRPHVQKTLTHFNDHQLQPETPCTVAVVLQTRRILIMHVTRVLMFIIHQIFSLARDWSKRVTWPNIPQVKLGNIRD